MVNNVVTYGNLMVIYGYWIVTMWLKQCHTPSHFWCFIPAIKMVTLGMCYFIINHIIHHIASSIRDHYGEILSYCGYILQMLQKRKYLSTFTFKSEKQMGKSRWAISGNEDEEKTTRSTSMINKWYCTQFLSSIFNQWSYMSHSKYPDPTSWNTSWLKSVSLRFSQSVN